MRRTLSVIGVVLLLALASSECWSATWLVTKTADGGNGSLRWAIDKANTNAGADRIDFAPAISGQVILPTSQLPVIADDNTVIDGDIDDDGLPDIGLNGRKQTSGYGLQMSSVKYCKLIGLAVYGFPDTGVSWANVTRCTIRSCNLGVNIAGTRATVNGAGDPQAEDMELNMCPRNTIGGTNRKHRNAFSGGSHADATDSLNLLSSHRNTIIGNTFGLARDGVSPIGTGAALVLNVSDENTIGGPTAGERNVFAASKVGAAVVGGIGNYVVGNYFGLATDGKKSLPITDRCVSLDYGAKHNEIGGTTLPARNVFCSKSTGIRIFGDGTRKNRIYGNFFGSNAAGTAQRKMEKGVRLTGLCGVQYIGGSAAGQGNTFCPKGSGIAMGVEFDHAGSDTEVVSNTFGVLPNGALASTYDYGVSVASSSPLTARVTDNHFAQASAGILAGGPMSTVEAYGNLFRRCLNAVHLSSSAYCRLGNLGNTRTDDDGGNEFRSTCTTFVHNNTPNNVKCEGSNFNTTSRAAIDAKIYDKKDNGTLGLVDFDPLEGGVTPTGGGTVGVAGVAALPTAGGAEVVFTLAAPAEVTVTVINMAGRPIATVAADSPTEAGTQRLAWSGKTSTGLAAPAGTYLVRVTARGDSGGRAQAVAPMRLVR